MEIGLPGKMLQQDYHKIALLITQCWLSNILEFLHTGKVPLEDQHLEILLRREKDEYLMTILLQLGKNKKKLLQLNQC